MPRIAVVTKNAANTQRTFITMLHFVILFIIFVKHIDTNVLHLDTSSSWEAEISALQWQLENTITHGCFWKPISFYVTSYSFLAAKHVAIEIKHTMNSYPCGVYAKRQSEQHYFIVPFPIMETMKSAKLAKIVVQELQHTPKLPTRSFPIKLLHQ